MPAPAPPPLIAGLMRPAAYPHPVAAPVRRLETHISWVFLTGSYAYKVKKPVDFGFLDYTDLAARRHFCEEELRLNRRLAPELYLDVVPVTGTPARPRLGGKGPAMEYAVKMREFPQEAQLDRVLARGGLAPELLDDLAERLARFHDEARAAGPGEGLGGPEQVAAAVRTNFRLTAPFVPRWIPRKRFRHLSDWSEAALARLRPAIEARLAAGRVRECHGDAHLRNMALIGGRVVLFDCIEFNPAFRFTDVMAEIAFTRMDLDARGRPDLGARVLDRYLAAGGDYEGLAVLPLYLSYRAYVRAKVTCLSPDADRQVDAIRRLVDLADAYTRPPQAALVLMHGVTGSGKSAVAAALVERIGAVRIRSDAERKRLAGVTGQAAAAVGVGIYDAETTERTYARLHALADGALAAGFPVVLDATYLRAAHRRAARGLAEARGVPFVIAYATAPPEVLAERVTARAREGRDVSDATLAVLDAQRAGGEPLDEAERTAAVTLDTAALSPEAAASAVAEALGRPAGRADGSAQAQGR